MEGEGNFPFGLSRRGSLSNRFWACFSFLFRVSAPPSNNSLQRRRSSVPSGFSPASSSPRAPPGHDCESNRFKGCPV